MTYGLYFARQKRHGGSRRDDDRIVLRDQAGGLGADGPLLRDVLFFLLIDMAVADIGTDQNRTAVSSVQFFLLFEIGEVFADGDLRDLEQFGQLGHGDGAVLLKQRKNPVMTFRKAQNSLFAGFVHVSKV